MRKVKGKSEQQIARERELTRSYVERREVDPTAWGDPPRATPANLLPISAPGGLAAPSDVFTGADLTPSLLSRCQKYPMPGTDKHLFVFPVSPDDVKAMLRWSVRPDLLVPPEADKVRYQQACHDLEIDLKAAQVILCTRIGPSRGDARCFSDRHLPALGSMLGHSVLLEICRISDELAGNEEALGASTRRFFAALLTSLQTLLGACATWEDCPRGLTDTPRRLLSLGTRIASRGSIASGLMDQLREIEQES